MKMNLGMIKQVTQFRVAWMNSFVARFNILFMTMFELMAKFCRNTRWSCRREILCIRRLRNYRMMSRTQIQRWRRFYLINHQIIIAQINIIVEVISNKHCQNLNHNFQNHCYPTICITEIKILFVIRWRANLRYTMRKNESWFVKLRFVPVTNIRHCLDKMML